MKKLTLLISIFLLLFSNMGWSQKNEEFLLPQGKSYKWVKKAFKTQPGAYNIKQYINLLKGKRVGIFANQTSTIGNTHLVDSLQKLGITITKIFGPEHGFRGTADAGAHVTSYIDSATKIPVVSLYGSKSKPSADDLQDVDILVFDLQDVGLRFYTYILSMQNIMETAIDSNIPLIILDRPNPNGFYVDGPVLEPSFKSGVGPQPVPVVYGMTMGEYAKMLIGEHWLKTAKNYNANGVQISIIKCKKYNHKYLYQLPVHPSPNLPNMQSIYWYASTCFFEGTNLSEGRGTDNPFLYVGGPQLPDTLFSFTPISRPGALDPKCKDQKCYGWNFVKQSAPTQVDLSWIKMAYNLCSDKNVFFLQPKDTSKVENYFFNKLAGNSQLKKQITENESLETIRQSWQPELNHFKFIRKKYLLYKDF